VLVVAAFLLHAEEDGLEEGVCRQLAIHQIILEILDVLEVGLLSVGAWMRLRLQQEAELLQSPPDVGSQLLAGIDRPGNPRLLQVVVDQRN
jgi:hypothetical protein